MFQTTPAPETARYLRWTYNVQWTLYLHLWTSLGGLIAGLIVALAASTPVGLWIAVPSGLVFLVSVLFTNWFAGQAARNMGYRLESDHLVVESGVFVRRKAKIPFNRVQDVTSTQGPIERRFGLHTLLVQTAGMSGPTGPEGRLRGITDPDGMAQSIMTAVRDSA